MTLIERINSIFNPAPAGAAHAARRNGVFVEVYSDEKGWFFSWFDEKHENGAVSGPYDSKPDAIAAQDAWKAKTRDIVIVAL